MPEMMDDGWYRPETIDEEREYSKANAQTSESEQRVRVVKASAGIFHGEKKIVTDRCRHCPLRDPRTNPIDGIYHVCTHPGTDGWEIEHLDLIPSWCVLEDNDINRGF